MKSNILTLRQTTSNITDLVLTLLTTQPQDTGSQSLLLTLSGLGRLSMALSIPFRSGDSIRRNGRGKKRNDLVFEDVP